MPTKIVNINGGLDLQSSEYDVGFDGFTVLRNLRQERGRFVRRKGTGALTSFSSKEIDTLVSLTDRKLTGCRIVGLNTNNLVFQTSTMEIQGTINDTNIKIPGGGVDFTSIFKAGDTIILSTAATTNNKNIPLVIQSLTVNGSGNPTFTFETSSLTAGTISASEHAEITFIIDRNKDGSINNLQINDTNSYNGNALCITYDSGSDKKIALLNVTDFGDEDIIDVISGASGHHIRPKVYTDAIRFAFGLEMSPKIFQYINRHHFNGILKSAPTTHIKNIMPQWHMDTSIPVVQANTYNLLDAVADEPGTTADNNRYIKGTLNIVDNEYDYKFVPVYNGNQEGLLNDSVVGLTTAILSATPDKDNKRSVLNKNTQAVKITTEIDMTKLNPRTSALNVYRSTNGGTYYKIKTIYMGDNDPNQHYLTTLHRISTRIWWSGTESIDATTLDDRTIMLDGFKHDIDNGNGDNNFQSTGYKSLLVETSDAFTNAFTGDLTRSEYGNVKCSKFNDISKATDIIIGGDDNCSGGSATGGWYIADDAESALTNLGTRDNVSGYNGSSGSVIEDYATENPVSTSATASQGLDFRYSNTGANANLAGKKFHISSGNISGSYIISGWAKAEGLNHPESSVHFYVSKSYSEDDPNGSGEQVILKSQGIENANFPWTYFQYQIDGFSTETLYGYIYINTPDDLGATDKESHNLKIWGLSLRQVVEDYDLDENLRGFMGPNVAVGTQLEDLHFPPGSLKGNRIIKDAVAYPVHNDDNRTFISDNFGPFLRTVDVVPGANPTSSTPDGFLFGSSNYQFYFGGTDNTNQKMRLDFFDTGLPDGARHPYEFATSTDVKFKYATMLNGRQFVANVKITGEEQTEEYSNFVMYSEVGSPDIIPTSNFIQLEDLQGGEIVGIETLMSDIIVFMTKGIFRINVPSGDPTNWSLVEAHPDIGCLHDRAIAKAPNGIFFCSKDSIHYIDSSFSVTSITEPIKDVYQTNAISNESTYNLRYDVKHNRLYFNYLPSTASIVYVYDIVRGTWYQDEYKGYSNGFKHISTNHENELIAIDRGSNSNLQYVEGLNYNDANDSNNPVIVEMKTGKQILSSLDNKFRIRRVNSIVERSGGTTKLDLDVITDQSIISKDGHLNGKQSTRVQSTGKDIQLQINNIGDLEDNNSYDIKYLDVEYE